MTWNTHTVSQQRVENFPWTQKNQYKLEIPSSRANGWQSGEGILGWKNKIQEHQQELGRLEHHREGGKKPNNQHA